MNFIFWLYFPQVIHKRKTYIKKVIFVIGRNKEWQEKNTKKTFFFYALKKGCQNLMKHKKINKTNIACYLSALVNFDQQKNVMKMFC